MHGGLGTIQDEGDSGRDSDFSGDADEQKPELQVVQEDNPGDNSDDLDDENLKEDQMGNDEDVGGIGQHLLS